MSLTVTFAPVLDAVRSIDWPARRRVRGAVPGPHLSFARGTTAEVVEHRPYRQGDDPKRIDWKLVARTTRVYTRLSQEHTILPTMLVLDASASMAFPAPANDKWDIARRIAIGLAAVARQRGDPVGMTVVRSSGTQTIAPRARRTVIDEMMRAVQVDPEGSPQLAPEVRHAAIGCARLAIITDFLGDADAILAVGRTFVAAGGELYAIHVVDFRELDPDPTRMLLTDPEQPELRRPMPLSARAEYIRRFAAWRETLARDWRHAGALYSMVVTGVESIRGTVRRITTPASSSR